MQEPKIPENEAERLADLRAYEILDTVPEEEYDGLTALAAEICETPIALVSLVESDRQWFKSRVGLDATQTDRAVSFCAHAVVDDETLVVRDAWRDERFADNPLVEGDPNIRFYAGALLRSHRGANLGTLCVIDTRPRELSETQVSHLETIARQVEAQLELRRQMIDGRNLQQLHEATSRPKMSFEERIGLVLETGAGAFELSEAYLSRVDGQVYEIQYRNGDDAGPAPGERLALADTYCALTVASGKTMFLQNAGEERPGHAAAARFGSGSYLGAPVVVD
ncbi:MAG: GAF domain-containing protein, partial [Acidobacteriota bacterium]|nr:GAF domain-containing protein [Acidobacteriota bacterium]